MRPRRSWTAEKQLFKEGALAGRLVEESRAAYAQAEAQYQAAEEHLKTLQSVSKEEQSEGRGRPGADGQGPLRLAGSAGGLFAGGQPASPEWSPTGLSMRAT